MHASIYFDKSDPSNPGWAYRIDGGESGPIDDADAIAAIVGTVEQTEGDLADSLAAIADALPSGVETVGIHYAEDAAPIPLALHP